MPVGLHRDLARILKMPVQIRYFPKKCLSRGQAASAAREPLNGGGLGPPEAKGSTCSEVHSKGYPASKIGNLGRSFDGLKACWFFNNQKKMA